MSKSISHRGLRLERLENREVFAGDVHLFLGQDGALNIAEKFGSFHQAQAVEISRTPFDYSGQMFRVKGVYNAGGQTTLVDGAAYKDIRVPSGNVNVNLGFGDDRVYLKDAPFNILNVDTGGGQDMVMLQNGMKTKGTVTVRTGADSDFVGLYDAQIGNDSLDNLNIYMDTGVDTFYSKGTNQPSNVRGNLNLNMNQNDLDKDVDNVTMNNAKIGGSLVIRTGSGDDTINLKRLTIGNDLFLNAGADKDTAVLSEVQALDDFWAYMGSGDDTLDLDDVWADRLETYGVGGRDRLIRGRPGQVNVYVQPSGFELYN
jgi:hypothetical protein